MLNEREYRREGIDEAHSQPVVLSDGQAWLIPKPWLQINPVFRDGKPVTSWNCLTCGPVLDELLEAISASESNVATVFAAMALGAMLLLRNYDLTDEELASVLVFRPEDADSLRMLKEIIDVATGQSGPKR